VATYLVALIEQIDPTQHWADTEYGPTFFRLFEKYGGEMLAAAAIEQVPSTTRWQARR
jgi:hypothetical protein